MIALAIFVVTGIVVAAVLVDSYRRMWRFIAERRAAARDRCSRIHIEADRRAHFAGQPAGSRPGRSR